MNDAAEMAVPSLPIVQRAPQRTPERVRTARGERITALLLFAPLLINTFLPKWGAPAGPRELSMAVPLMFVAVLAAIATGRARFDRRALVAYLAMAGALGAIQVWRAEPFSQSSYLLMLALYLGYVIWIPRPESGVLDALRVFSSLGTLIAAFGVAQFGLQFVLDRSLVFPIDLLLPQGLLTQGYNPVIPLYYGAQLFKANGVFLLEPSFFSQYVALAILVELALFNRLSRLLLYLLALVLSYSGTGILVLAVGLPALVIVQRRWDLVGLALAALASALLLAEALNLQIFAQRAQEFSDPRSSAFERFVGAFYVFDEFLWNDWVRSLLGYGAGNYGAYAARASAPSAEMALWKMLFEFGVLGMLANLGFLIWAVLRGGAPLPVKLGVATSFLLNGLYTPATHGLALTLLIWPAAPSAPGPSEPLRRSLFAGMVRSRSR